MTNGFCIVVAGIRGMAKRIVLLGPPGAGKGTQAQVLCERMKLAHLATGGLLREAVAHVTPVGVKVKPFMESGRLVPDEIVIDVLMEAVDAVKKKSPGGYVLDGFPRTYRQAPRLRGQSRLTSV